MRLDIEISQELMCPTYLDV